MFSISTYECTSISMEPKTNLYYCKNTSVLLAFWVSEFLDQFYDFISIYFSSEVVRCLESPQPTSYEEPPSWRWSESSAEH